MSGNSVLQLCLDKAEALFSKLPPNIQDYLSRPLVRRALVFIAATQLLRSTNRYLSKRAQNNWVSTRPWNASKELVLLTGGSSGIGKEIMQDLSKLGVKVIIFDVQEPKFPLREWLPAIDPGKYSLTAWTSIKCVFLQGRY